MTNNSEKFRDLLQNLNSDIQGDDLETFLSVWEQDAEQKEKANFLEIRNLSNALSRRLRQSALNERALNHIFETTHDLSSSLSISELFQKIVSRARNLVNSSLVWLTIYDEDAEFFRTPTIEGHLNSESTKMTANEEYGIVNIVLHSRQMFETTNYLEDTRFNHTEKLDKVMATEGIQSLAGFPIITNDEFQGLLFIAERHPRKLSESEKSLLDTFAQYAGVAMRNAQMFNTLRQTLAKEERIRSDLQSYINSIEISANEHDEMTSLLANGAPLKTFIQKMANKVKGAVLLLDETLRVHEEFISPDYQGDIAGEIKTGKIGPSVLFSSIHKSQHNGRSVKLATPDDEHCLVIALHESSQHGESLFICYQDELAPMDVRNIERNAVALAIAKLWNDRRETEKMIASSTLLRHLILVSSPDGATLNRVSDRLNLSKEDKVILALITFDDLNWTQQSTLIREQTLSLNLLVDLIDNSHVAIGTEAEIQKLITRLEKMPGNIVVGGILSSPLALSSKMPKDFQRLQNSLTIVKKIRTLNCFLSQNEVNLFAKLFENSDSASLNEYIQEQLASITKRDPQEKKSLKKTLLSFFDSQYNIAKTSDHLGIHINTVRQRLDTLRDITGGWDSPIRALELHVSLKLDALTTKKGSRNAN